MKKERIGIFGGTFNPIHFGHLRAAEEVRYKCRLDKILFIPSYLPPHKNDRNIASPEDRWQMLCLALSSNKFFIPSKIEIEIKGKSYSIDTLNKIQRDYPEALIFFILGVDAFWEIKTWKNYLELIEKYFLIVISRPGYYLESAKEALPERFAMSLIEIKNYSNIQKELFTHPKIFLLPIRALNISSTEIRDKIKKKESIKYLVPLEVEEYIIKNRLYQ
ncbi:MAG: nicotinate-nucleotide adenylyltransferase [Candidatus Aminicenantia bacterium]